MSSGFKFVGLLLALAALATPVRGDHTAAPPDTVTATVCVAGGEDAIQVITGFHLALKMLPVRPAEDCSITIDDRRRDLADLKPGQVVRITCHRTEDGLLAHSIEAILLPGEAER